MATTLKLVTGELVDISAKYPSNYWHTPTYAEMNYILNTRTNASNLRTFGRVLLDDGTYRNGLFLLPDDWVLPVGISMTITTKNYTTNTYNLSDFEILEQNNVVFFVCAGRRLGVSLEEDNQFYYSLGSIYSPARNYVLRDNFGIVLYNYAVARAFSVRLCKNGSQFSTSDTTKIDFAHANLQYHCTQHIWRFAEHSYDVIGADNANISDSYDGWIDLFGYGTSGVNYSPTLHTTDNADYAQGDLLGTVNDWGYNKICVDSNPLDTRTKIYENKVRALEFSNI